MIISQESGDSVPGDGLGFSWAGRSSLYLPFLCFLMYAAMEPVISVLVLFWPKYSRKSPSGPTRYMMMVWSTCREPRPELGHNGTTFTFTLREFSRRFYPKSLTESTFLRRKFSAVHTVRMFIEPSAKPLVLTHSPYTTKLLRIRCYTMFSTIFKCVH